MKKSAFAVAFMLLFQLSHAQSMVDSAQLLIDSLEASLHYQQGEIKLDNGVGTLQTPAGFRYLDAQQSAYVLQDLWGNPDGSGTLGMIVPQNTGLLADNSWAFVITYDEMGYVKDDDADDIDYEELMGEMQRDTKAENEERNKGGFEPIELVGWASKPFYDQDKKVLHWAKEIRFGASDINTLNYNVRILGRKGVVVFNAVSSMNELPQVQQSIEPVLSSFSYADGFKYTDFDPSVAL
jgi:uncharacterized membrane-anchored protein